MVTRVSRYCAGSFRSNLFTVMPGRQPAAYADYRETNLRTSAFSADSPPSSSHGVCRSAGAPIPTRFLWVSLLCRCRSRIRPDVYQRDSQKHCLFAGTVPLDLYGLVLTSVIDVDGAYVRLSCTSRVPVRDRHRVPLGSFFNGIGPESLARLHY